MKIKPDTFAFPIDTSTITSLGLSTRELCAFMAMQGILAGDSTDRKTAEWVANQAVECADALLAKLNEG